MSARGRRYRIWPAVATATLLMMVGVWAFIAVQRRMGLTVGAPPPVQRSGTAQVRSCSRDPLYLWLTWTCDAQVRWPDGQREERVRSVRALDGTVDVAERIVQGRRRSTHREVVPADYPTRSDGGLFFLMLMGFPLTGGAVGFFVGGRLGRLLPEKPETLTLRSREQRRRK